MERCNSEKESNDCSYKWSIIEILFTAVTTVIMVWPFTGIDSLVLKAAHNWTTLYIPLAAGWVYLFAINKGVITKILNNRAFIFLGNISANTFLIHYVITQYTNHLLSFLNLSVTGILKACIIASEFIVTIIATLAYMRFRKEKVKL